MSVPALANQPPRRLAHGPDQTYLQHPQQSLQNRGDPPGLGVVDLERVKGRLGCSRITRVVRGCELCAVDRVGDSSDEKGAALPTKVRPLPEWDLYELRNEREEFK